MSDEPGSFEPRARARGLDAGRRGPRLRALPRLRPRPVCPAPVLPGLRRRDLQVTQASGRGRVYALTTVARAPSPELATHAPYVVALIDAEEGFRFMAHAAEGLAIGAPVHTAFRTFGAGRVPYCLPQERE